MDQSISTNIKKRPKIGLALGSGGARGLAHVGVIKVLEENNIPIGCIAGASIGAVVGGFYAAKKNVREMEEIVHGTDWKKFVALLDPSLRTGILRGEKAQDFFYNYIGHINFSDLLIPFAALATDYETGDGVVLKEGEVVPAIRASMSVPMAFHVFKYGKGTYVDGGMSVPVPVGAARDLGADIVVAVNLDGDYFSDTEHKKVSLINIAVHSMNMMRHNLAKGNMAEADVAVTPKVGHIRWYDFVGGKASFAAGEQAMRQQLENLNKAIADF